MMRSGGLPVDVVMYNLLMTAYKKKRQWQSAQQTLQQMVQVCSAPSSGVSYPWLHTPACMSSPLHTSAPLLPTLLL